MEKDTHGGHERRMTFMINVHNASLNNTTTTQYLKFFVKYGVLFNIFEKTYVYFCQIDGDETREENIADTDGLKKAFYVCSIIIRLGFKPAYFFQAYQKWVQTHNNVEKKLPGFTNYSAEQMFFISFGQLWCSKMTYKYALAQNLLDDHAPHQFRCISFDISTDNV
jgi:predicted metalloendopeptidase